MSRNIPDDDWFNDLDKNITSAFNRFAGKTVDPGNAADPVLEDMRQEARMQFSQLRLVPPGTEPPVTGRKITRVNAELIDDGKGNFRIGNRFFRG